MSAKYAVSPTGSNLDLELRYTIYPTGRVGLFTEVTSAVDQTVSDWEFNYGAVNYDLSWTREIASSSHATWFVRTGSASPEANVLFINSDLNGNRGYDSATTTYWSAGSVFITAGNSVANHGELTLSPAGLSSSGRSQRLLDLLNPELDLTVLTGATVAGAPYDAGQAAYLLTAQGTTVTFGPTATYTRFDPVFVMNNWSASTWSISRNTVPVVSSAAPITAHGIGYYHSPTNRLIFVYRGSITSGTPAPDRTFTLTNTL